ncbi:hypothetical protein [Rothia aeria]|uniref:hypothetical protein n=1 Tax=Rothia aeria TaxID=172042 RepID=UPI001C55C89B|nr:hypothetical protein [Rothia aeria]QXW93181.1 hypothetical protein LPB401_03185 [Rothia aeria]
MKNRRGTPHNRGAPSLRVVRKTAAVRCLNGQETPAGATPNTTLWKCRKTLIADLVVGYPNCIVISVAETPTAHNEKKFSRPHRIAA